MFTTKVDTLKHNFFVAFIDLMKLKLIKTDAIEYVSSAGHTRFLPTWCLQIEIKN